MASPDPITWLRAVLPDPAMAVLVAVTHLGSGPVYGLVAGLAILAWDRRRGLVLSAALLAGAALNVTLKAAFGWARPPAHLHEVDAEGLGFPSGHAQTNGVFWGTLARFEPRRAVLAAGAGAVALVSFSRVALGVHYPRDVVAGAAVGLALAGIVALGERAADRWAGPAPFPARLALAGAAPVPLAWADLRGHGALLSGALAGLALAYVLEGRLFPDRPVGPVPAVAGLAAGAPVAAAVLSVPTGPVLDWAGAALAAGAAAFLGPWAARRLRA